MPDTGPRKPLLINFHDDMSRRLSHLKGAYGFDPAKAELEVQGNSQLAQSLASCRVPVNPKVAAERAARFHKLISHCSHQAHLSTAGMLNSDKWHGVSIPFILPLPSPLFPFLFPFLPLSASLPFFPFSLPSPPPFCLLSLQLGFEGALELPEWVWTVLGCQMHFNAFE